MAVFENQFSDSLISLKAFLLVVNKKHINLIMHVLLTVQDYEHDYLAGPCKVLDKREMFGNQTPSNIECVVTEHFTVWTTCLVLFDRV